MTTTEFVLFPLYKALEIPIVYRLTQQVGKPTTDRYRKLMMSGLMLSSGKRILDLGCGLGAFRDCFPQDYTGIDINRAYIERASSKLPGRFETMDCTDLQFPDASFDAVATVATTHHLNDEQVVKTIQEALRVCGSGGHFHVVDAIMPVSPNFAFKRFWFGLDRGRFPRELEYLLALARSAAEIVHAEVLTGPLHDTAYLRLGRNRE